MFDSFKEEFEAETAQDAPLSTITIEVEAIECEVWPPNAEQGAKIVQI